MSHVSETICTSNILSKTNCEYMPFIIFEYGLLTGLQSGLLLSYPTVKSLIYFILYGPHASGY